MNNKWHNQAVALAGLAQAVDLMDKLAKTGYLDSKSFETCVKSLFSVNPDSIDDVYGGCINLETGLEVLSSLLKKGQSGKNTHLMSYGLSVLHLQKKLSKNNDMLNTISAGLERAQQQSEHFGITHENVVANLADTYSKTISTFKFRIQVSGEQQYLQQPKTANQVRVLLLSAIRAATLWRQSGGNQWTLLFQRSSILAAVEELLKEVKQQYIND